MLFICLADCLYILSIYDTLSYVKEGNGPPLLYTVQRGWLWRQIDYKLSIPYYGSVIIAETWVLKIEILTFSHILHTQPPIPFVLLQIYREFMMILRVSKRFWSMGGTEILTMISVQECSFFSYYQKIEQMYISLVRANSLWTMNDFAYLHSLEFLLIIYVTQIGNSIFHNTYQQQGQFHSSGS